MGVKRFCLGQIPRWKRIQQHSEEHSQQTVWEEDVNGKINHESWGWACNDMTIWDLGKREKKTGYWKWG